MKLAKLIFALSVITASSLSGSVMAHEHRAARHDGAHHERHLPMKRMLAGLDLTDNQREQIKQLMQQQREAFKREGRDNAAHLQLQALLIAEQFDESAARQLLEQQQQRAVEKRLTMLKLQHQVLQVLTEEQRQQLAEKHQHWQQKKLQRQSS
ncbi:hypothetical protein GCM10009098_18900 [Rheinheimera aquimaris]|uniref:Periplasmic heavy metal sensor n=1 Tax=Rheinheimera aquimaris TaxID=412437 RepID=A0ABN1DT09_9GAMM|nr:Spy/CpxP family protein refolding chaperone [Rheinheimera aquimaris]MCB5214206.1 Spy/CpxP family protein refolding chaperone [Rheinheimera aquimaris]